MFCEGESGSPANAVSRPRLARSQNMGYADFLGAAGRGYFSRSAAKGKIPPSCTTKEVPYPRSRGRVYFHTLFPEEGGYGGCFMTVLLARSVSAIYKNRRFCVIFDYKPLLS